MEFCPVCDTKLVGGVCRQCNPVDFQELPYKSWLTWMRSQRAAYHIIGPFSCDTYYIEGLQSHNLPFSQWIISAKRGSKEAANYLCEKMYDYLQPPNKTPSQFFNLDDVEIIVPVPNERHVYTDALPCSAPLIADEFAKIIRERVRENIRSYNFILERVGKSNLYRKKSNPVEKYRASLQDYKVTEKMKEHKNPLKNKIILLIDDIRTSGITIGVCASWLLQLGAKQVIMFCAGRTDGASVPYLPSSTKIKRI